MCGHCGCSPDEISGQKANRSTPSKPGGELKTVTLEQDLLDRNKAVAAHNRQHVDNHHLTMFNLISSPGAGKTSLLVETLARIKTRVAVSVIEGDQQTERDAERIRSIGVPAVQLQTGRTCHLDAAMVHSALHQLPLSDGGFLFVENVGNLICPAQFDLGEHFRIVLCSVTEGEDKPLKYPFVFRQADLILLTKTDLLPYLEFDTSAFEGYVRQLNPDAPLLSVNSKSQAGLAPWLDWLTACKHGV